MKRNLAIILLLLSLLPIGSFFIAPKTAHGQSISTLRVIDPLGVVDTAINTALLAKMTLGSNECIIPRCIGGKVAIFVLNKWIAFLGWLLWATAFLWEFTLEISVEHLGALLGKGAGAAFIASGWKHIRDISNFLFIFILLWTAVKTILGVGGDTKRQVVVIILAALLINFSAAFTRIIIDPANVLALTFYNKAKAGGRISEQVVNNLQLVPSSALAKPIKIPHLSSDPTKAPPPPKEISFAENMDLVSIVLHAWGSSLYILAVIVLFLTFSLMLLIRTLILTFLVMVSPWPFVTSAFSGTISGTAQRWWKELTCQAYWLPVSMALFWVSLEVVGQGKATITEMMSKVSGLEGTFFSQIIFFFMSIGLLYASLTVGKRMGCSAVGNITDWGAGKIRGMASNSAAWLGRNTLGRAAGKLAESSTVKALAARTPLGVGRFLHTKLDQAADLTYGGKKGFVSTSKQTVEDKKDYAKRLGTDKRTGEPDKRASAQSAKGDYVGAMAESKFSRTSKVAGTTIQEGDTRERNERRRRLDTIQKKRGELDKTTPEGKKEDELLGIEEDEVKRRIGELTLQINTTGGATPTAGAGVARNPAKGEIRGTAAATGIKAGVAEDLTDIRTAFGEFVAEAKAAEVKVGFMGKALANWSTYKENLATRDTLQESIKAGEAESETATARLAELEKELAQARTERRPAGFTSPSVGTLELEQKKKAMETRLSDLAAQMAKQRSNLSALQANLTQRVAPEKAPTPQPNSPPSNPASNPETTAPGAERPENTNPPRS